MSKVVAVIVTYNRINLLKECLDAVRHQSAPCHILTVDNASTDGTAAWLDAQTDIEVIHMARNAGGAGGFAEGMRVACLAGYDYIWIMDDDTVPKEDTLAELLSAAAKVGSFGFLASEVDWTDGSPCRMNRITEAPAAKIAEGLAELGIRPAAAATFVSLLFPSEIVRKAGLPKAEYFIWGDDKEYTLRLSDSSACYAVAKSRVTHKMAVNAGSNIQTDEISRIGRYFYAYRNDLATACSRGAKQVLIYFAAFLLNTLRVIFSAYPGKGQRLKAMYSGMAAGLTFRPAVHYVDEREKLT